jgi:hypothetical protein
LKTSRFTSPFGQGLLALLFVAACTGKDGVTLGNSEVDDDGDGYLSDADCDDDNAAVNPGAQEICDAADLDENCNGTADNADSTVSGALSAYRDSDVDGYGDAASPANVCELIEGYAGDATDCDDTNPRVHPGATEVCDEENVDEDCDALADDADPSVSDADLTIFHVDADRDGFGSTGAAIYGCDAGVGYAEDDTDCDDSDPRVNTDALEVWYDGVDGDCSGGSDFDQDGDDYDSAEYDGDDCDDLASAVFPGSTDDLYDGIDADCGTDSDFDADGDGQDDAAFGGDDCDDTDADIYTGAYETGTADNNCDGVAHALPWADADYDTRRSLLQTCDTLFLDGSGSRNPSGGSLTYDWTLVLAPSASSDTTDDLKDPDDESPTFNTPTPGDYTFALVVSNLSGEASYADELTVTIADRGVNSAPVANAGANQSASKTASCSNSSYTEVTCAECTDTTFTLVGTASSDADGDELQYEWAASAGGTLSSSTDGTTTVTIPGVTAVDGTATRTTVDVTLYVTDCFGDTSTDTLTLTVDCTGT